MQQFAMRLCTRLGVDEIVIYGEAYRHGQSKAPSWHPFGFKLPSKEWELHPLTTDTHSLFMEVCALTGPVPRTHTEFVSTLANASRGQYLIFPPPLFFQGTLAEGVEVLFE
eukprot:PhF_6_TR11287/c0_g1_i2/m.18217